MDNRRSLRLGRDRARQTQSSYRARPNRTLDRAPNCQWRTGTSLVRCGSYRRSVTGCVSLKVGSPSARGGRRTNRASLSQLYSKEPLFAHCRNRTARFLCSCRIADSPCPFSSKIFNQVSFLFCVFVFKTLTDRKGRKIRECVLVIFFNFWKQGEETFFTFWGLMLFLFL